MLNDSRDELVEGEERVRVDSSHVPQLLLVRLLINIAVKELLGEVQRMLVVVLCGVVAIIHNGHSDGESELHGERVKTAMGALSGELSSEFLESREAMVDGLFEMRRSATRSNEGRGVVRTWISRTRQ